MTALEQPGTVVMLDGRYQLNERVGIGGTAEVYRAEDTLLGRTVAVKLMRPDADVLASPERTQREVTALAALNHPSLVTLLDASVAPGRTRYLVMEFVEGPTLAGVLGDGPLSPEDVSHLATELAAGVQAVHQAHLVHRDIKPSNILLAPASKPGVPFDVKLADFGLVQLMDSPSVTSPGLVMGTAAYLAPEQVRGEPSGPAADIYALGLVLLEALTGERAFGHASGIGAVMARLLEPPAIPETLDADWAQLIRRMTADAAEARPTAAEVAETIAALPAPTGAVVATGSVVAAVGGEAGLDASVSGDADDGLDRTRPVAVLPQPLRLRERKPRSKRTFLTASLAAAAGLACVFAVASGFAVPGSGADGTDLGGIGQIGPSSTPDGAQSPAATLSPQLPAAVTVDSSTGSGASVPSPSPTPSTNSQTQGHSGPAPQSSTRGQSGHDPGPQHGPPKSGK